MIKVEGHAKINLTLDVLGKRDDDYHEVAMIMQSVALGDTILLDKTGSDIALKINLPWLVADEKNLAWQAAELVKKHCQIKGGVRMFLTKRIPVAAGLGGGSADAAAVLRGMNALYDLRLSDEELCALGAKIGSDIPFCVMGGTMMATGRGEILRALPSLPTCWIVLAKPHFSVSTPWVYSNYDSIQTPPHLDTETVEKTIIARDLLGTLAHLGNVLEYVTIQKYDIIAKIKQLMLGSGAVASLMAGSGPTVFGVALKKREALKIARSLKEQVKGLSVFVARTSGVGVRYYRQSILWQQFG